VVEKGFLLRLFSYTLKILLTHYNRVKSLILSGQLF